MLLPRIRGSPRARAALHLYRRPHAVALLQGLADPEAQALLAVSNGNLVLAEPLMQAVKDPAGALTLALEVEALRAAYGKTAGVPERRQALLDSHPGYAALLYAALSHATRSRAALALIGKQLDGRHGRALPPPQRGRRTGLRWAGAARPSQPRSSAAAPWCGRRARRSGAASRPTIGPLPGTQPIRYMPRRAVPSPRRPATARGRVSPRP
jgi:hypothetical protein